MVNAHGLHRSDTKWREDVSKRMGISSYSIEVAYIAANFLE